MSYKFADFASGLLKCLVQIFKYVMSSFILYIITLLLGGGGVGVALEGRTH